MSEHENQDLPPFEKMLMTVVDGVAVITLNRPYKLNALSSALLEDLELAVKACGAPEIGAVVITGSAEAKKPAFAAGADIGEMADMDMLALRRHGRMGQAVFNAIERLEKPVIAAINGFALGGGMELAMACHVRYASEDALMGQPEINLGLIPGFGGTQRLTRLVGRGRALEMLLTGDPVKAAEAERLGLVNRVYPADALMDEVMGIAKKMAAGAPIARACILEAVLRGEDVALEDGLRIESDLFGMQGGTEDTEEGLSAFLEKRKPEWKGR